MKCRSGRTQKGLCIHRRWLEVWNFRDSIIRVRENKGTDQLHWSAPLSSHICKRKTKKKKKKKKKKMTRLIWPLGATRTGVVRCMMFIFEKDGYTRTDKPRLEKKCFKLMRDAPYRAAKQRLYFCCICKTLHLLPNFVIVSLFHYITVRFMLDLVLRSSGFPTSSDKSRALKPQKIARGLKF